MCELGSLTREEPMMSRTVMGIMCVCGVFGLTESWAGDRDKGKADDAVQRALGKIARLGPGVHAVKKDRQGRIQSCMIVGESRISTVLGKAKGLETARGRARLDASAQFIKWLKEDISVHEKSEDETILFVEGSKENDEEALKESGKAVEKTGKKIESVCRGLVRGLQVLHVEVSGEDKTYTLVMGWSAEDATGTKGVGEINDSDTTKAGAEKPASGHAEKKPDKKIEDKQETSDDAKKFLPDK
jgi:hypothetical protein